MEKILRGVIKYRQTVRKDLVKQFKDISNHPDPKAVMFTCMDSRMLPTRFTQSRVGDIFVVRNAGNMIPDAANYGFGSEVSVTTEPAALELAVKRGGIRHVLVCGHSDCKAMNLLYQINQNKENFDATSPMDHWVRRNGYLSMKRLHERLHVGPAVMRFESEIAPSQSFDAVIDPMDKLTPEGKLSQINVLQQLLNVSSHQFLREHFETGQLFVHAMWFDVFEGEDFLFSRDKRSFIPINENTVESLKSELDRRCGEAPNIGDLVENKKAVGN